MANVQVYDPFSDAGFDELFRGFFRPVRGERSAPAAIKLDVSENEKGYVVEAELPGVTRDEIQVSVEGNQVTIATEVKRNRDAKDGERVLRSERYYGQAYRSFTLPVELDEAASEAKYANGVLTLTLAKKAAVEARRLRVQ